MKRKKVNKFEENVCSGGVKELKEKQKKAYLCFAFFKLQTKKFDLFLQLLNTAEKVANL